MKQTKEKIKPYNFDYMGRSIGITITAANKKTAQKMLKKAVTQPEKYTLMSIEDSEGDCKAYGKEACASWEN